MLPNDYQPKRLAQAHRQDWLSSEEQSQADLHDNSTSRSDAPPRSDRRLLILHRAWMLSPWLLIVAGVLEEPVSRWVEPVAIVIIILAAVGVEAKGVAFGRGQTGLASAQSAASR
jgi:hypothetical protein